MADSEGFCVVKTKVSKGRRKHKVFAKHSRSFDQPDKDFDFNAFNRRLNACIQEILLSDFFTATYELIIKALSKLIKEKTCGKDNNKDESDCKEESSENVSTLPLHEVGGCTQSVPDVDPNIIDLLSYGIGNFTSCPIARYQLSLLIALRDKLSVSSSSCHLYDPMFLSHEVDALKQLGFNVISENEEGKRECIRPTVAFLPHCGKALYNNFLWKNLKDGADECSISNLVLIGNSFTKMIDRIPERTLMKTGNYIMKVGPYMDEESVPTNFVHKDVFNDLSIHSLPKSQLSSLPPHIWQHLTEPIYSDSDVEYIKK